MEYFEVGEALHKIGIDPIFVIQETFLGYKYRKREKKLYNSDSEIPANLIRLYYGLNSKDTISFDTLKKTFVTRYINNESKLEGVENKNAHSKVEIEGLGIMYEYIHSDDIDYMFNIYTLKELHQKLFSLTEHPECAGDFRRTDVYLPGTGTELSEWRYIRRELNDLDEEVQYLVKLADVIRLTENVDALFEYINRCIVLKCKIIKIHPFIDGNGRVTRGFINKLFEMVGLPPIYIKENERTEYHKAMNLANNENSYAAIQNFYLYKICDSIIELDINERIRKQQQNQEENQKCLKK